MKVKMYKGRDLGLSQIEKYSHVYLPDDYDLPCYRIFLNCNEHQPEDCYYYMDIIIDENNVIKQIERYRDIYLTNYFQNRFPDVLEKMAENILMELTG